MDRRKNNPHDKSGIRPAKPMDARRVALNALSDVNRVGAYASLALSKRLNEAVLSSEDRRLTTSVFYSAVENKLQIEHILHQLLKYPPQPVIMDILMIACAQILYLDRIPDHAAVDEAVKQVKRLHMPEQAGFVNGTLRNLLRAKEAGTLVMPKREDNPEMYLSVTYSVPERLLKLLTERFGAGFTEELISYRADIHEEIVRPNLLRTTCADFETFMTNRKWDWKKSAVPGLYHVKSAGELASDPGFLSGLFTVQGESSVLAARAVCARPGQNILDACAAPGGKSACLAEAMNNTGRIYAWDLHEHRVGLIKGTMQRLKLDNIRPAARDASELREDLLDSMDAVLVDAPCSGLGVICNKPEIKYKVTEDEIKELTATQKSILDTCCRYVRPGGTLVYSTCSILPDENEKQIDAFLLTHPEFETDNTDNWLPDSLKSRFADGRITFYPHKDGMEGFFVARMRRKGSV